MQYAKEMDVQQTLQTIDDIYGTADIYRCLMIYDDPYEFSCLRESMEKEQYTFADDLLTSNGRIYALHVDWFEDSIGCNHIEWDSINTVICIGPSSSYMGNLFADKNLYVENLFEI